MLNFACIFEFFENIYYTIDERNKEDRRIA